MNRILLACTLLFTSILLSAQDIIYTISGELEGEKVSTYSFLVENLSNNTLISFIDLPEEEFYKINPAVNARLV